MTSFDDSNNPAIEIYAEATPVSQSNSTSGGSPAPPGVTYQRKPAASLFFPQMKLTMAPKFCHRLGTGLKAGANLMTLLKSEASQGPAKHRTAIKAVAEGVNRGETLSDMMALDKYFPPLMTAMIRVGEETGKLEHTLLNLSEHYQHQLSTRRGFITSIAWPGLQLFAGIGIIACLILLLGILTPASGGRMPDMLGFGLYGPSGAIVFLLYVAAFFGFIAFLLWCFFRNVAGVQNLIPIVYKIPMVGPSIQTITISKFCWTLSLSLGAGLDPIRSIALALDSTGSDYYRSGAEDARDAILGGATMAEAIEATAIFPAEFIQRIEIAEHSGTDAESIDFMTKEYDERAKRAVKVIAGFATIIIRVSVMAVFIFMIFRLASFYLGALSGASEPINPHSRFGN